MVVALVILTAIHLVIASFVALNSVFEAECDRLTVKDLLVVVLVSTFWPVLGCILLSAQACRKLRPGKRDLLPTAR